MNKVTVADHVTCTKPDHDVVYIGSFGEHEGTEVSTFYCKDCNCTWNEL